MCWLAYNDALDVEGKASTFPMPRSRRRTFRAKEERKECISLMTFVVIVQDCMQHNVQRDGRKGGGDITVDKVPLLSLFAGKHVIFPVPSSPQTVPSYLNTHTLHTTRVCVHMSDSPTYPFIAVVVTLDAFAYGANGNRKDLRKNGRKKKEGGGVL